MPAFAGDGLAGIIRRVTGISTAQTLRPPGGRSRRIAVRNETATGGQPLRLAWQVGSEVGSTASNYVTIQPQSEFELPIGTEALIVAADDDVGPCDATVVWMI